MKTTTKAIIASLLSLLSLTASAYTVTFDAGTGVCGTTERTSENTITLPVATHSNSEYSFIGWSTVKKTTEDGNFPTDLLAPGSQYTNDKDVTLYAVYSKNTGITWERLEVEDLSNNGIYALMTYITPSRGNTFNGEINDGVGGATKIELNFYKNIPTFVPEGTCELIFIKADAGFSMQNSEGQYLTAKQKAIDNLDWNFSPITYWKYDNTASLESSNNSAKLRSKKNTGEFTTYASGGQTIALAHKITTYTSTPPTSYAISVSAAGYSTFYSSMNAFTMPEGMAGYVVSWDNANNNISLTRKYESEAIVPADEPLVLKATPGNYTLNYVSSDAHSLKNAEPTGNILIGTDVESKATTGDANNDSNYYFYSLSLNATGDMNSVGFYWVADDGAPFPVPAHKAYLALQKSLFTKGAKINFVFSDYDTDGITSTMNNYTEGGPLYNTMGQRVSCGTMGIVIRNGRKYINR